jgi:hypothetical protein
MYTNKCFFFFYLVAPCWGVAQAKGLAGLTPAPALNYSPRIELGDDGYCWGGLTMVCEFCLHFLFVQDFWLWTCGV